jgi:hypothetical protein
LAFIKNIIKKIKDKRKKRRKIINDMRKEINKITISEIKFKEDDE